MGSMPWLLTTGYDGHLKGGRDFDMYPWQKQGIPAYFERLLSIAPHYIVVPLENCDFNKGKSNIAWLEGTLAGAACISRSEMPEFDKVPSVRFDTPKSLHRIFEQIGKREDLRTENYMRSRALIESEYLLSHTNKKRLDIIDSL